MLGSIGIHNWEYWETKVYYETACGKHKHMNHWSVTPNRKCKWTGTEQHKYHNFNSRMMPIHWKPGNLENNKVVKIYLANSCEECFDLLHGNTTFDKRKKVIGKILSK